MTKAAAKKGSGREKAATEAPRTVATRPDDVRELLERMKPQFAKALPRHMSAEQFCRVALTAVRSTPALLKASQQSLLAAIMQCAQLGLEPGPLQHAYLVPFRNKKLGTIEVQFIIGYRGLLALARRSGEIESIAAHEVRENDTFEFEYGLDEKLRHVPALANRGEITLFYAYAKFRDGGHQIHVMTKAQVDAIRDRSKAADSGPWVTDYVEMGRKTVLRNLCKYLPISVSAQEALAQDDDGLAEEIAANANGEVIDIDPPENGEEPEDDEPEFVDEEEAPAGPEQMTLDVQPKTREVPF